MVSPCETHLFFYTCTPYDFDVTSGSGTGGSWWTVLIRVYCGVNEQLVSRDTGQKKKILKRWQPWNRQYCYVGNTPQHCRLRLFQDSDFAGDLEESKSTSGGLLCIFGSHTFVPISCMCKEQTSVPHSSTEAEIISLDAGLRMDGIPVLDLWDLVVEVFNTSPNQFNNTKDQVRGNSSRNTTSNKHTQKQTKVPTQHDNFDLNDVDCVPSNAKYSRFGAMQYTIEDVIKMIIEGRSPTMRHVSRTHRVALDWLFDRINPDPKIQAKYVDTKHQLADILTKGNFTRDEWNNLLHLFKISHFSLLCCSQNFSLTSCTQTMAKRMQEQEGENKIVAKSKPTINLVSVVDCTESGCVEKPGDTQSMLSNRFVKYRETWRERTQSCNSGCRYKETRRDSRRPGTPELS